METNTLENTVGVTLAIVVMWLLTPIITIFGAVAVTLIAWKGYEKYATH